MNAIRVSSAKSKRIGKQICVIWSDVSGGLKCGILFIESLAYIFSFIFDFLFPGFTASSARKQQLKASYFCKGSTFGVHPDLVVILKQKYL